MGTLQQTIFEILHALQQLIFLSGAMLAGFGEVRLERLYREGRRHRHDGFAKAMVGLMGAGLIGFTVSAVIFVLRSVSPVDNPLLIYWKIATWCIFASFGFLSLLYISEFRPILRQPRNNQAVDTILGRGQSRHSWKK